MPERAGPVSRGHSTVGGVEMKLRPAAAQIRSIERISVTQVSIDRPRYMFDRAQPIVRRHSLARLMMLNSNTIIFKLRRKNTLQLPQFQSKSRVTVPMWFKGKSSGSAPPLQYTHWLNCARHTSNSQALVVRAVRVGVVGEMGIWCVVPGSHFHPLEMRSFSLLAEMSGPAGAELPLNSLPAASVDVASASSELVEVSL